MILPTPLETIALSAAAQSLIYPLGGGLTIVFSQLSSPYTIGEKLTRLDWLATLIIISGIVITVAFANQQNASYNVSDLIDLFKRPLFIGIFGGLQFISLTVMILFRFHKPEMLKRFPKSTIIALALVASLWCATQGIVLKNTAELVAYLFSPHDQPVSNPFTHFESWIFLICIPVIGAFQIIYMNHGLQNYPAVKFIPIYNTLVVIVPTAIGAIYFEEYSHFHPIAFPAGIAVVCIGILVLTKKADSEVVTPDAATPDMTHKSDGGKSDVGLEFHPFELVDQIRIRSLPVSSRIISTSSNPDSRGSDLRSLRLQSSDLGVPRSPSPKNALISPSNVEA